MASSIFLKPCLYLKLEYVLLQIIIDLMPSTHERIFLNIGIQILIITVWPNPKDILFYSYSS